MSAVSTSGESCLLVIFIDGDNRSFFIVGMPIRPASIAMNWFQMIPLAALCWSLLVHGIMLSAVILSVTLTHY